MKLSTLQFLNQEWECKEKKNKILVGRKKIGKGWHNSKQFLLPKEIDMNERIAECVGLYFGDGKTTDKDLTHAQFQSKDFDLAKKILRFFHILGVRNSDITFTLTYNKIRLEEAKKKFRTITKEFRIIKSERYRFPTYSMQVNGKIFRIFLKTFLLQSLEHIKKDSRLRKGFLRGYFAAEGWIGHARQENYLACVGFAYNPKTEVWLRDFCLECLNLEGINSKINIRHQEHNGQIIITNWENYYKLWKLGLFEGCERKKKKFIERFLDTRITCEITDGTRLRLFFGNQYELANKLGTYQASVSNMKNGTERNMWPTIEQVKILSRINHVPLEEIKKNIKRIRFGCLTILDANNELVNDLFNLRQEILVF